MKNRYLKYKHLFSLLMIFILLFTLGSQAYAVKIPHGNNYIKETPLAGQYIEAEQAAKLLSRIGVFKGSENGFGLEKKPTRFEGLIVLIRLLGKEQEVR